MHEGSILPRCHRGHWFPHRIANTLLSLLAVVAVTVLFLWVDQRQQESVTELQNLTQQVQALKEHIKSLENLLSYRNEALKLQHPSDNQAKTETEDLKIEPSEKVMATSKF
jgi:uncharacterized protein HemX